MPIINCDGCTQMHSCYPVVLDSGQLQELINAVGGGNTITVDVDTTTGLISVCDPADPADCSLSFFVNAFYDSSAATWIYRRADTGGIVTPNVDFVPCQDCNASTTAPQIEITSYEACDANDTTVRFVVREIYDETTGTSTYFRVDTGAAVTPVTDFVVCPPQALQSCEFCDDVNGDGSVIEPFTRYFYVNDDGTTTTFADTQFVNGVGQPYTTVGTVSRCDEVGDALVGTTQHLRLIENGATWSRPASYVASVSISVATVGNVASPPTITDADGIVTPLLQGFSMSWDSTNNEAPWLVDGFSLSTNAGDAVYVVWTEHNL